MASEEWMDLIRLFRFRCAVSFTLHHAVVEVTRAKAADGEVDALVGIVLDKLTDGVRTGDT